jgi:large subunit ribosomal protein L1
MPNAKLGSVTFDIARVVAETKKGKVDFKADKAGVVHALIGKRSFSADKLTENIVGFIDKLVQLKPSTSKGIYLRAISLSTTMGPGVKIDPTQVRTLVKS